MQNNKLIPVPDTVKLFGFLDSETINARTWINDYLSKQGVFLDPRLVNIEAVKIHLVNSLSAQGRTSADIKLFANKMGNAWRVKKHRQSKGRVSISMILENSIATKLSQMSYGKTKTEVVTQLIEGNYQAFLTKENDLKIELARQKRIQKEQREGEKIKKMFSLPQSRIQEYSVQIESLQTRTDELKKGIENLYDLIFSANEQGLKIDQQFLRKASKMYYDAIDK